MLNQLAAIRHTLDSRVKSRTAKCVLLVALYLLLHFSISIYSQFTALDEPMFYFTVVVIAWTIAQPWVERVRARTRG